MLNFANISQIEALFAEMEPENLAGEPFTPSLHSEEIRLDDAPPELEEDEELASFDGAKLGSFTPFGGSEVPMPLVAIDAGVLDIGISRTGFALAFKASVISQDIDGTHSVAKIGPRVKFIAPDNRAELLHFVGRGMFKEDMFVTIHKNGNLSVKQGATEPNQFKDRIRNFIERMLQLDVVRQLESGILLVDGALTLRTYNTPEVFLQRLSKEAAKQNSEIIGVSKKSRVTVDGVHIGALLDDDPPDAGYRRIVTFDAEGAEAEAEARNLGTPFAARFAPGGFTFRVDVTCQSLMPSPESVVEALYANTQMTLGYPNLLRLAHIHSAFTKDEIISLQVKAAHDYQVSMRQPEDLSVIFAPFRKGLEG
jgi:hypothetical protein